jgi:hypothetical protein
MIIEVFCSAIIACISSVYASKKYETNIKKPLVHPYRIISRII